MKVLSFAKSEHRSDYFLTFSQSSQSESSEPAKIVEKFNHNHLLFCEILKVHFENVISLLTCNLLHIRRHALLISLDFPFSYLFEVVKISLIYQYRFVFLTQSFID